MDAAFGAPEPAYDTLYDMFDSPLAQEVRREVYAKDIGQHSWVDARELERDVSGLQLSTSSRLLDLGCGPAGPLTFVLGLVGCRGIGVDISGAAITSASKRAVSLGLRERVTLFVADLDQPLDLERESVDAAMSLDVVLHLGDRSRPFAEMARVLVPGGRLLFTDAGVVTGAVSNDEIRLRSMHGRTQFVPPGFNERALAQAGFRVLDQVDRTASLIAIAARRLGARRKFQARLEAVEGEEGFARQQRYLETVLSLSQRGAMARMMYLCESRAVAS